MIPSNSPTVVEFVYADFPVHNPDMPRAKKETHIFMTVPYFHYSQGIEGV